MNNVKIDKNELLAIVKSNKETHIAQYAESVDDFKKVVLKLATTNLKLAKSGDLKSISQIRPIPAAPTNYAHDYERALRMLQLSVEDVIDIESAVFNQLVLDEWGWKKTFIMASSSYKTV